MNLFPSSNCHVLPTIKSDYSPLIIFLENFQELARKRDYKFRYEASWELKSDCARIIQEAWKDEPTNNQGSCAIKNKLTKCK